MTSERPNDTGTLAWVRSELDDTLQQAAQALNDYAEDASDRTQLRFCMTYLHQVYGTLQMLELYGLSGLVEDMEQSLDGLINGELENTDAMEEVLMRAILSVSDYLERIQRGEADSGLLVLPLRNELRSARGAEPLSESELFQPDLDKAPEEPRHERTQPSIIDIAHRRRHQYQRALLNYLRGQALERSLAQMQRILDELDAASGDDRSGDLWWIAAGVVDSLRHGDLAEAEGAVKRLLGQVDRQLKRVIDEGESVLREDPPRDILKDMLFYVGRSGAATDRVRAIQERFGLAPLRQDAESRSSGADSGGFRPGADILESVSSALREDITAVKDALDLFERSEHAEPERLEGAGDTLRRIGDTLGMLGLAAPRRAVRAQIEPVERLGRGEPGAEATCLEAARTLLYVESALDGLVATGATPLEPQGEAERGDATPDNEYLFELEYRSVHRTAISEALADIGSLKEALVALTEGRDEDAPLTGLEPVLERLQGALDVIGLDRAGALVRDAGRFIREELIPAEREIPQQRLDSLADAVTSLEYYLEAVLEDRGGRDRILEVAESSLGELGYAGTESDSGAAVADAATTSPSTADTSTLAADPSDGEDIVAPPPPDAGDDQAADSSPDADETAATPAAEPGTTEPEAGEPESITPAGAGEQAASTQTPAGPPRQAQTGRSGGVDPNVAVLADDMDQEILDIYLEEIDECMETIQQAYPRWRGDPDNHDALVTIRRMFHTLKGSGRLAGALLVGELAWSVERMLNRVIDGLLPPGAEIFGVIDRTLEAIPELAVELRDGTQPGMDVRAIMQEAARLVDGEPPSGPGPGGSSAAEGTPPDPSASATDGGSPAATDPGAGATDTDSDAEQSADADADTSEPASADATPAGPDLAEPAGDATADEVAAPDAAREVSQETPGDHGASEIGAEHSESPAETDSDEDAPAPEPSVTPESAAADDESGIAGDDASAASVADAAAETSEAAFGSDQEEDAAQDPEAAPAETDDGPAPGDMGDTAAAAEGPALDAEAHTATDASPADAPEPGVVVMDPTLYEIFRNEATDHLGTVRAFLGDAQGATQAHPTEDLVRSLHTLSGSARMADVVPVAALARDLEHLAANRQEQHEPLDETALDLLARGADTLEAMVTAIGNAEPLPDAGAIHEGIADAAREAEQPTASDAPEAGEAGTEPTPGADSDPDSAAVTEPEDASAATEAAGAGTVTQAPDTETHAHEAIDPDLVALFLEEAEDILGHLDQTMENLEDNPEDPATLSDIQRSLHTLKGGARLARFDAVANLCHVMEQRFADMEANRLPADDDVLSALRAGYDALVGMGVTARERGASGDAPEVLRRLQELGGAGAGRDAAASDAEQHEGEGELREVFVEEATELLRDIEAAQQAWMDAPADSARVHDLERALHTLKGGARMAGYTIVADLSHALEALLVSLRDSGEQPAQAVFDLLERSHDRLHLLRDQAASGEPLGGVGDLLEEIRQLPIGGSDGETETAAPEPAPAPEEAPEQAAEQAPAAEPPAPGAAATASREPAQPAGGSDQVRVRADLLDNLVNYAGEVSIYRARLDQQVGAFRFNIEELDQTVRRLRDQLRSLDIEAESQIVYGRTQQPGTDEGGNDQARDDDGFDPLEMDRYSRMQELSRRMGESVNDLSSIESMLDSLARESETLLLQQSRVNTELQDGLMRTRMVPFASLVPRLRRLVRQTATELGREARISVEGAQGEMDRTVLDRLVAPLEHMLRNSVAHGIETPEDRRAAGKPDAGQISLALDREGSDIVLRVADDGAGMDLDAIRRKARERGLIQDERAFTDREVMQFVMEQGFSTAQEVTQVAGRGVGMDVVNAEIKQLGGSLEIDSERGRGTTFTVRLPFTLAMNQALLCNAGDQVYAIPLTSIDGVVRITRDQMETYLARGGDEARYHYAGQDYQVSALTMVLGEGAPTLAGRGGRVPLILLQAGDYRVALQVDGLVGSREIVVKSVGPQISNVPGIYGATILPDGRVVLILDMGALLRQGAGEALAGVTAEGPAEPARADVEAAAEETEETAPVVMVVDDSITMRKVASRLLERNNMQVVTANDGVDAVARLQEHVPDAMLLDIEMPRMDGYELATHMRNDERLREVPIIMITSRTGEKHRARAEEIGVDRYLGKPYQEADLLDNLSEVIAKGHASQ